MRQITYLFFSADGSQPEILEHHPQAKPSPQIIGILPAELCASFVRRCPPAQKKYLNKTLPYLVEDDIASSIDEMHCLSQPIGNSQIRVLAIGRDKISECLNQAEALGLKLDKLYIDADLIEMPTDDKFQKVITCNGRQLIKTSKGLIASLNQQDSAGHIQELTDPTAAIRAVPSDESGILGMKNIQAFCIDGTQPVINGSCPPLNLLQGDFAPRQTAAARAATVHKVLMLAMVVLFVQMSYWLIAGATYQEKAEALRQQSEATYRGLFPEDKKIIDLVAQAEGHLSQLNNSTQGHSFQALLAELGKAIKANDKESTILLKSVQYQKATGQLRAELVAKQISAVEKVQTELGEQQDLAIETEHISESPSATDAFPATMRLTLKSRLRGVPK